MVKLFKHVVLVMVCLSPLSVLAATPAAAPASATLKVGIFDPQVALWNTDAAQKALKAFKADIKVQEDTMADLKKQLDALSLKMKNDGSVMSDADKKKIQVKGDDLYRQYQNLAATIQEKSKRMQQQVISSLTPKLEKAIAKVQKDTGFDLVLDAHAAIIFRPDLDITKRVIENINSQVASGSPSAGQGQ
ncbi:MAG: OmpH family outer membrane protein [Pseudomonadales bacterium]|nr:OmpH family outer membrane protein [Pseudomonadales bacterium]